MSAKRLGILIGVLLWLSYIAPFQVFAQEGSHVWFGNPDGSPFEVQLGATVLIPVYVRVDDPYPVEFGYGSIKLGVHGNYITNITVGNIYSPFSDQTGVWDGPFVQGNITTYEFTGEFNPLMDNQSHGTAQLLMEFQVTISSDPSLIGQTVNALYDGYNPNPPFNQQRYTYFLFTDDLTYTPATYLSQLTIVDNSQNVPTLSEWGMLIMGLLLLALGTIAVARKGRVALSKAP